MVPCRTAAAGALRPVGDLGTVELKCRPAVEARIYSSLGPLIMSRLAPHLRSTEAWSGTPRGRGWVIAAGSKSRFPIWLGARFFEYIAMLLGCRYAKIQGATHFAPQEQPQEAARLILDLVETHLNSRVTGPADGRFCQ